MAGEDISVALDPLEGCKGVPRGEDGLAKKKAKSIRRGKE